MKKILEKSGKSQGILSEEKSGNPVVLVLLEKQKKIRRPRIKSFRELFAQYDSFYRVKRSCEPISCASR